MPTARAKPRPAFTLIELVLVLTVIAIALTMVSPSLRGWSKGAWVRDTADQVVTLTRLARTRAASTGQVHRVVIDAANRRCVVLARNGQQFAELGIGGDSAFPIPDDLTVQMIDAPGGARDFIEFLPNGRSQAAKIRITSADGDQMDVESQTATEPFRVIRPGEAR